MTITPNTTGRTGRTISILALAALLAACTGDPGDGPAGQAGKGSAAGARAATASALDVEAVRLAQASIPSGLEKPFYFKVQRVSLPEGASLTYAAGDGMVYQLSGVQHVRTDTGSTTLQPGQGLYLYAGLPVTFNAGAESPVEFLHILLVPAPQVDRTVEPRTGTVMEIFRIPEPLVDMPPGSYEFELQSLTLEPQTPPNPPHYRTGAAVYYVLSGEPRMIVSGKGRPAPAGSIVYEPRGLVHQWSNPGEQPAAILVASISPAESPPIKLGGSAR